MVWDEEGEMKKKDTTSGKTSEWDPAPEGRVTPQEVQQKEFRVARFGAGYRMREVDEFLDQVTDAMSALVAENERLLQGSADRSPASNRPSTPPSLAPSVPPPADDAGRAAVDAFLRREKGFLQELGGLVQGHTEELRSMVRDIRRDVAGPVAASSQAVESRVEPAPTPVTEPRPSPEASPGPSPEASPGPSPDASTEPGEPPAETVPDAEAIGTTEHDTRASDDPEDETQGNDTDASGEGPIATTGAVAEEPIRLDEPEPARSGRSDEEEEGSLRELFWGEE
jgi:DivIVA domain-containing protein